MQSGSARNQTPVSYTHLDVYKRQEQEIAEKRLVAVRVPEVEVERKIYLVQPSRRAVSYAADAFLRLVVRQ